MQSTIIIFPVSVFTNFYFFSVLPSFLFIAAIYFDFMALNHTDNQLRIWNVKEISLAVNSILKQNLAAHFYMNVIFRISQEL